MVCGPPSDGSGRAADMFGRRLGPVEAAIPAAAGQRQQDFQVKPCGSGWFRTILNTDGLFSPKLDRSLLQARDFGLNQPDSVPEGNLLR